MKPVFKCDYCNFMGTSGEVEKHEQDCMFNYDLHSCHTCAHRAGTLLSVTCDKGVKVPDNHIYKFCKSYKRRMEEPGLVDLLFGGRYVNESKVNC